MAIEVINYDFRDHPEQFQSYFTKILKLIIISKLNCIGTNRYSVEYYKKLVNRIDGCGFHTIKYGKLMLFTEFLGHKFNYHTVRVTLKIDEHYSLEISIESIIRDFVKIFDVLSADSSEIKWNYLHNKDRNSYEFQSLSQRDEKRSHEDKNVFPNPISSTSHLEVEGEELKKDPIESEKKRMNDYENTTFSLLDSFINALYVLMNLTADNRNSMMHSMMELKDISLTRRILSIEILVNDQIIIIDLNPKGKNKVSVSLDNDNLCGETIKALMIQNNFR